MTKLTLITALVCALGALWLLGSSRAQSFKTVNVQDLAQLADAYVLDVREPWEFSQGHIKGAHLLPLGELSARLQDVPQDRPVYVVCRSGNRSSQASAQLVQAGYTEVINVAGGMNAWEQAGLPLEPQK